MIYNALKTIDMEKYQGMMMSESERRKKKAEFVKKELARINGTNKNKKKKNKK